MSTDTFREAMFSAARAQLQALPDAPDPVPFMCGLEAQNAPTFAADMTPADVDAEVERIEREAQEADTHYDRMKNSGELRRREDEAAIRYERDSLFTRHLWKLPSEGY